MLATVALVSSGCGGSDSPNPGAGPDAGPDATVVVTTNILGDVVEQLAGDEFEVLTVMPVGVDPHSFQASAKQVADMNSADLIVANGSGFEETLADVIDSARADGGLVFEATDAISTIDFAGAADRDEADHGEADHGEADHGEADHDEHYLGVDPHFFTDPERMVVVVEALADFVIANIEGIDPDAVRSNAADYIDQLESVAADTAEILTAIPEDRRVLVTNHQVFGYFAERYDFEVVGAVVPSGTTADGTSAQALAELAEIITREGVAAIFADTSSSGQLIETLAAEAGAIEVVALYSESLGEPGSDGDTYLKMVRANAERIAEALGS